MYALFVEHHARMDNDYKALCDISHKISCSKVFTSEYSRIFAKIGLFPQDSVLNQPNALYGVVFYIFIGVLSRFMESVPTAMYLLLVLSMASLVLSSYLAFVSFYILEDLCIVCATSYLCNFGIFLCCIGCMMSKTRKNKHHESSNTVKL